MSGPNRMKTSINTGGNDLEDDPINVIDFDLEQYNVNANPETPIETGDNVSINLTTYNMSFNQSRV